LQCMALTMFRTLRTVSRDTQSRCWPAAGAEKCSHIVYRTPAVSRDTQSGCWPAAGTEKCSHLFIGLCAPFRVTRNPDIGKQLVPKNALTLFRTLRADSRDTQSGYWPAAGAEKSSHLFLGLCAPIRVTRNPDVGRQLVPKNALTLFRTLRDVSRDTQSGYWPAAGAKKCSHLFLGLCAPFCVTHNPDVGRQLVPKNALTLFRTLRLVSLDTQSGYWPAAGTKKCSHVFRTLRPVLRDTQSGCWLAAGTKKCSHIV
jgi:hypothetical protein